MKLFLSLSSLALVENVLGAKHGIRTTTESNRQLVADPYWTVFQNMNSGMVWPAPNSTVDKISSTFGPRIRSSCSCYDFHRGVDIHGDIGDDVVATYGGLVKTVTYYTDGGKAIVLEHRFSSSNSYEFQGRTLTKWYTHYFHLSEQLVAQGDSVEAGDLIGRVGDTGNTTAPHLHHEVRLGTRCSLEYALKNPQSTCNTYGFDPHVHPLLVYPTSMMGVSNITLSITQIPDSQTDGKVHLVTPGNAPDVNGYFIQVMSGGVDRLNHTLDLNLRTGFNATSTAAIDTPDTSKPYLDPLSFGYMASEWEMDLIIPPAWFETLGPLEEIVVTATNVWNEDTVISFGL